MDVEFAVTMRERVCVVQPRGVLTERTRVELRRLLAKVLLNQGSAVVDLDGVRLARESCVTIFPAVLDHCGGWPRARMVLCRPDHGMARALAQRRVIALVPVYRELSEAKEAIEQRPAVVRARTRLGCDDHAPGLAQQLVRDTCPMWQVGTEQQQIAELVVGELVDNAVRHARTAAALTLERGARGLRIAVRDTAPQNGLGQSPEPSMPSPPSMQPQSGTTAQWGAAPRGPEHQRPARRGYERRGYEPGGRGLELVARLAAVWGVERHPVGKTVWAEILQADQGQLPTECPNG